MAGHLASAVGTPCVVIGNGISHPSHWRPRGEAVAVVRKDVPCAPCHRGGGCATMECVRGVTVDAVEEAARGMLARPAVRSA
jgi:ADP-heptose:LPS heptosyltransferase